MPKTCPHPGRGTSLSDTAPDSWIDRECEPLPRGWIANLLKREFLLWNIVMIKLEDPKHGINASNDVAKDTLTLARLRRSLGELMRYEAAREELRMTKMTGSDEEMRDELNRRLDRIAAASQKQLRNDADGP